MSSLTRCAGILAAISSLDSPHGIGTFGDAAYRFVDYLKKSGISMWQILPLGPTGYGDSPYASFSAFAGNPYFIDLDYLIAENLLKPQDIKEIDWGDNESYVDYEKIYNNRFTVLKKAYDRFIQDKPFKEFCDENSYWLDDFTLFMAVKNLFNNIPWLEWPENIRLYRTEAVHSYRSELSNEICFYKFLQYKFYEQWYRLKAYANKNDILIVGDIPIYVSLYSADTWSNYDQLLLDSNHKPTVVAGCPPDAISYEGQLWGNPIYNYQLMKHEGFSWWKKRISFSAQIYDVIKIDHFKSIARYYGIPYGEVNAVNGSFFKGPGKDLINVIDKARGSSSIIAEDLGNVTDEVRQLIKKSGYYLIKIIQHAFDGNIDNEHLPINFERNNCVYTGAHDNDTLVGAIAQMDNSSLSFLKEYCNIREGDDIAQELIRLLYASVADVVIFQLQDILGLDSSARMNIPSTVGSNWKWRVKSSQLTDNISHRLHNFLKIYGR